MPVSIPAFRGAHLSRRLIQVVGSVCLALLPLSLRAQVPPSFLVGRTANWTHTSADGPRLESASLALSFDYGDTALTTRSIVVRLPNLETRNVPRESPKSFYLEETTATPVILDAAYPSGEYRFTFDGDPDNAYTVFSPGSTRAGPGLANFDALQNWDSPQLSVERVPSSVLDPGAYLLLTLEDAAGNEVASSPDYGEPGALDTARLVSSIDVSHLPAGDYTGYLAIIEVSSFFNETRGVVSVQTLGHVLRFPVRLSRAPPRITRHPVTRIFDPIYGFTLDIAASGQNLSYQWFRDGEPIPGATASHLVSYPPGSAGRYHAEVTNAFGTTRSETTTLTAVASQGIVAYLGHPGESLVRDGPRTTARIGDVADLTADRFGRLWFGDGGTLRRINADGSVVTIAGSATERGQVDGPASSARFGTATQPIGHLAADSSGHIYVAAWHSRVIRRVDPAGNVTTLAGRLNGTGHADGQGAAARFMQPFGPVYDGPRNRLLIVDANRTLRAVSPTGEVTTVAGNPFPLKPAMRDGRGANAEFQFLQTVTVLSSGRILVVDANHVREISPEGDVTTLVNGSVDSYRIELQEILEQPGGGLYGFSLSGIQHFAADLSGVRAIGEISHWAEYEPWHGAIGNFFRFRAATVDHAGRMFVADWDTPTIREIRLPAGERALDPADHAPGAGHLVNLAVRAQIAPTRPLIAGYVLRGEVERQLALRGVGPALASFGVADPLPAPKLTLFNEAGATLASQTRWQENDGRTFGAFPLAQDSGDAALVASFRGGAYTLRLEGGPTDSGTGLLEIYHASQAPINQAPINLSTRGHVGPDAPLIAGFVLEGDRRRHVLIRGIGASLRKFGVPSPAFDPTLTLYRGSEPVMVNMDWDPTSMVFNAPDFRAVEQRVGAFPLTSPLDSIITMELPPGAYTAVLTVAPGHEGEALIEVYTIE